jgi:hypothetical protein
MWDLRTPRKGHSGSKTCEFHQQAPVTLECIAPHSKCAEFLFRKHCQIGLDLLKHMFRVGPAHPVHGPLCVKNTPVPPTSTRDLGIYCITLHMRRDLIRKTLSSKRGHPKTHVSRGTCTPRTRATVRQKQASFTNKHP